MVYNRLSVWTSEASAVSGFTTRGLSTLSRHWRDIGDRTADGTKVSSGSWE